MFHPRGFSRLLGKPVAVAAIILGTSAAPESASAVVASFNASAFRSLTLNGITDLQGLPLPGSVADYLKGEEGGSEGVQYADYLIDDDPLRDPTGLLTVDYGNGFASGSILDPTDPITIVAVGGIILWERYENISDRALLGNFTFGVELSASATANARFSEANAYAEYSVDAYVTQVDGFEFSDSNVIRARALAGTGSNSRSFNDVQNFTVEIGPGEFAEWIFQVEGSGSARHSVVPLGPAAPFLLTGLGALALVGRPREKRPTLQNDM